MKLLVDKGGEKWIPWAKRQVAKLDELRRSLNLPVMVKTFALDASTTIQLKTAEWGQWIRITGGPATQAYTLFAPAAPEYDPQTGELLSYAFPNFAADWSSAARGLLPPGLPLSKATPDVRYLLSQYPGVPSEPWSPAAQPRSVLIDDAPFSVLMLDASDRPSGVMFASVSEEHVLFDVLLIHDLPALDGAPAKLLVERGAAKLSNTDIPAGYAALHTGAYDNYEFLTYAPISERGMDTLQAATAWSAITGVYTACFVRASAQLGTPVPPPSFHEVAKGSLHPYPSLISTMTMNHDIVWAPLTAWYIGSDAGMFALHPVQVYQAEYINSPAGISQPPLARCELALFHPTQGVATVYTQACAPYTPVDLSTFPLHVDVVVADFVVAKSGAHYAAVVIDTFQSSQEPRDGASKYAYVEELGGPRFSVLVDGARFDVAVPLLTDPVGDAFIDNAASSRARASVNEMGQWAAAVVYSYSITPEIDEAPYERACSLHFIVNGVVEWDDFVVGASPAGPAPQCAVSDDGRLVVAYVCISTTAGTVYRRLIRFDGQLVSNESGATFSSEFSFFARDGGMPKYLEHVASTVIIEGESEVDQHRYVARSEGTGACEVFQLTFVGGVLDTLRTGHVHHNAGTAAAPSYGPIQPRATLGVTAKATWLDPRLAGKDVYENFIPFPT